MAPQLLEEPLAALQPLSLLARRREPVIQGAPEAWRAAQRIGGGLAEGEVGQQRRDDEKDHRHQEQERGADAGCQRTAAQPPPTAPALIEEDRFLGV